MEYWASGYTQAELDEAQERHGLRFPPDLIALLLEKRPVGGHDWSGDDGRVNQMLAWPFDLLLFDVEHGLWGPDWGVPRPAPTSARKSSAGALDSAPRLIPIFSHRFLPETPNEAGSPVFSMHGSDTIYYGSNLDEYFANAFGRRHVIGPVRHIPFWSDIVERPELN